MKDDYLSETAVACWKKKIPPPRQFVGEQSALLIIDMQDYFLNESSHAFVPSGRKALSNILLLVDCFKKKKRPIFLTYFAVKDGENDSIRRWWQDTVSEGTPESRITPPLHDAGITIRKSTYDAFHQTPLLGLLQKQDIHDVLITGVLTNLCCETTARQAFVHNFNVFFVMDATATYTKPMHEATLKNLGYGFASLVTTKDVIQ